MASNRLKLVKRWAKRAAYAVVSAIGLVICLVALSRTVWAREYAGYQATQALRRELNLMASIGEVEIDPLGLSVVARDIGLDHMQYGRAVDAAVLRIRPSWWALMHGQIDLHHITIERATVRLTVRDGRVVNLPQLPEAAPNAEPSLDLPFNFVNVVDSRLIVDAAPLAQTDMGRINVRLDASNKGVLSAELSAWDGWIEHQTGRDILSAIELSAELTRDSLQVNLARIATPDVEIAVRDARLGMPLLEREYAGSVALDLDVAKVMHWPHGIELPDLRGQLHVEARVRGDAEGPTADARITLDGAVIMWYGLGEHLELDVKLAKQGLTFQGFTQVLKQGGRVDLRGQMGFEEGLPLDAYADIRDVSFAKLMETLDVSPNAIVDWTLAGSWTLRGTLDPLDLSGPLKMPTRDFQITREAYHQRPARSVLHIPSAKLDGTVSIRPRGLGLQDVDIELPDSHLHADVLLGFDNKLRATATTTDLDLKEVSPLLAFPLQGRGGFDVEIAGTFVQPTVAGHMKFSDFAFNTYPFGTIEGDFDLEDSLMAVHFAHIDAAKRDSKYRVNDLRLDFNDQRLLIEAGLDAERLTLRDFYDTFHWEGDERYDPYQGEVAGAAHIKYTLGFPGDLPSGTLRADIDVDVPKADLDGFALENGHFTGSWHWLDHTRGYRGGELRVEHFAMKKGTGTVSLSGQMSHGGKLDLVLLADRIAVHDTEGLAERIPTLDGSFGVTAEVKGTGALPRVHADVMANELRLDGRPMGDGRLYVRLTDKHDPWIQEAWSWPRGAPPADAQCGHAREGLARGQWPADPPLRTVDGPLPALDEPMGFVLCGEAFHGALSADLMVGRSRTFPVRGLVTLDGMDLGKLIAQESKGPRLEGSVSGQLRLLGGALLAPGTLIGDLTLTTLKAGQLDVELRNDGPLRASFDRGTVAIHEARFVGPDSELVLSGSGDLAGGLALAADGRMDLGLLTHVSSAIRSASGAVDLHFKVTGSVTDPQVFGNAQFTSARLALASYDKPIDSLSGRVTFSAQRILFEQFRMQVADGTVDIDGVATLRGQSLGSFELNLNANHLDLSPRDGIKLRAGGRGTLAWKQGADLPRLSGTLRLEELVYTRPIKMGRTLEDMVKKERAEAEIYDPDDDLIELDLNVVQAKPVYIKNNLIDAELLLRVQKQPFRLVGTDQRLGVLGNMSVKKGTVRFRDAAFAIRQGDIAFDSRTRIDPSFDILAVTDVRRQNNLSQGDWHITIHSWGNRDSFQFQLHSDPYLSEDDIALLLTVGMTHSELAQLETGDLTGTAALEALATVSGVEREVHRALPEIDDFHIASAYSERSNRTEPQLFIGKRLNDKVRLSASTGIAESRDFSTGVELQLTEETSVEAVYNNQNSTSISQLGDVGVDLKWRLEFD